VPKVLLVNWDNYPNSSSGGVYAWAKQMVDNLQDTDFVVLNCLSHPNVSSAYTLPKNVVQVMEIPLYGCQRYEEFYAGAGSLVSRIKKTTDSFVEKQFVPLFDRFFAGLISDSCDTQEVAKSAVDLHRLLLTCDSKKCLESPATFRAFASRLSQDPLYQAVQAKEASDLFHFMQRMIQLISFELPRVDLVHSSNAWIPAFAGICAKQESGCKMIVTEHGVAFKDLLLYHRLFIHTEAYNILWKILSSNIIRTVYAAADTLAPVCAANAAAAELFETPSSKIRVIYNGVDGAKFRPVQNARPGAAAHRPTVVYVGRLELLKDILGLVQAVDYMKRTYPDILCLVYGSSTDLEYAKTCVKTVRELHLQDNIKFMGNTPHPEEAYNAGDIVILSSLREGFPYTVVEAMSCGKVVVSTDVGGVREALEGCGSLVTSRHPQELALAVLKLLGDKRMRDTLEANALKKIGEKFSLERSIDEYRRLYGELAGPARMGVS
jgi:glycosyltransferase involved in cell wall biosynthesis